MKDQLTEELAALRRFRARRLKQLMRDRDEGRPLSPIGRRSTSEALRSEASPQTPPTPSSSARRWRRSGRKLMSDFQRNPFTQPRILLALVIKSPWRR